MWLLLVSVTSPSSDVEVENFAGQGAQALEGAAWSKRREWLSKIRFCPAGTRMSLTPDVRESTAEGRDKGRSECWRLWCSAPPHFSAGKWGWWAKRSTFCSAFLAPTPVRPPARTLELRICIPSSHVTPPPSPNSTGDPEPQCDQANHEYVSAEGAMSSTLPP